MILLPSPHFDIGFPLRVFVGAPFFDSGVFSRPFCGPSFVGRVFFLFPPEQGFLAARRGFFFIGFLWRCRLGVPPAVSRRVSREQARLALLFFFS